MEAKVVPMVVAPTQPDAPGFSTLPATPALESTDGERSTATSRMERQEVDLGPSSNARCFILTDVLTPAECARLIHAAERAAAATNEGQEGGDGWEKLGRLFASEYRGGDRLLVMDEPLAHELWQRIKPGLTRDDVLRVRPIGTLPPPLMLWFGNAGTWRPYRLNECLKLVRYKPGDHFSGHVDGPWVPKLDESSIYTVIVYLNDDYKGGCTNFRSENTQELLWRVTPRAGQALIFNHDTYHEGEPVLEGMMFQRVDTGAVVARDDYLAKPTYRKLVRVYEKSNDAIDQGDVKVFVEKYLQAIQLQRDEQRSLGEDKLRLASELELPYEIYMKIFAHLSPTELARLQLVSKLWYDLARDGALWKQLYRTRWQSLSPTGSSQQPQVSNAAIEDWYGCWKTRTSYERATHSTVVAVDCGSHSIKCARTTTSPGAYKTLSDRSVITTIRQAHSWHYRTPARYYFGEEGLRQRGDQVTWLVRRGNVLLMSSVTAMVLHCLGRLELNQSPIIFCVPPTWDKEWSLLPRTVQRFDSPFLCAEDSGVLVLASYGKKTGIVVDVGFEVISVSPVHEGKLLRQFVALSRQTSSQAKQPVSLVWAPDYDADTECPHCLRPFSFLFRRHHCRMCGLVRCRDCMVKTTAGYICESCQGKGTEKPHEWEEEEEQTTSADAADGAATHSRESYEVAALLLISVIRRLHRHQNGPQLNLIDLDSLRHNVVITGGGSIEEGWDASFERALGRLAGEQLTPSYTLHQVAPARKAERVYDAAQGACMMVEARPHAPFDNIFQHVTIKTPTW